jgi:threonine/homoserine/homoserine lactone efflux protein
MPETSLLIAYILASLLLLITPGPAVLYIIARGVDQGRAAGIASVLGLSFGTLLQIIGISLGISAVILSSALAFTVLKYLGALYLFYLGIRRFMDKEELETPHNVARPNLSKIFFQGVLVDLTNPKTALFFVAYFPQFVNLSRGSYAGQVLLLGILFVALGLLVGSIYAILAGNLGAYFGRYRGCIKLQRYIAGCVYIGLGIAAAVSGAREK